jgi:soluble lytic murein transglycosylase
MGLLYIWKEKMKKIFKKLKSIFSINLNRNIVILGVIIALITSMSFDNYRNQQILNTKLDTYEYNISNQLNAIKLQMNKNAFEISFVQSIILKTDSTVGIETSYMYAEEIVRTSHRYKSITPTLLTAVIYQESRFNTFAVSPAGAQGLGQIYPETGIWILREWNIPYNDSLIFDPIINIRMTAWYMDWLYHYPNICKKDNELRLAYYNGGGRQAHRYKLYRQFKSGQMLSKIEQTYVNRLSPETKNYVEDVINRNKQYQLLLNNS